MKAYGIDYELNGKRLTANVDAKDTTSAKRKLARKHKVEEKAIKVKRVSVIGYF